MAANRRTEYILPPLRERIDHYSFTGKESIGKGFSSNVFKGRDDHTEEEVAIKIIDLKAMKGEVHKNLLAAEIEILSLIKNRPNLLDVHKICSDKNKTYIITDYCEGGDLAKIIKEKKKLTETDAVKIIKQIIKGYESLYTLGIVHRDLKPANIFFHSGQLEIGDFGFAVKQENLKTIEKYNVGSPVYMPPEALNSNKYSHKSDIWAIGIIFYEMLAGVTPWTGKTEAELKTKIKTISIRNILPPNISKASSSFLRKTLEVELNCRMEPYEMFDHFQMNHNDHQDIYENEPNNRLFRSMRKPARSEMLDQIRGDSLKKTTNILIQKTTSIHQENLHSTGYAPIPKTAMGEKIDKEYFSSIQKRTLSKQLLSQIHFCRFLFKLISNIESGISIQVNKALKDKLINLLFYKLKETKSLKLVPIERMEEYSLFADYKKLEKLIEEYESKYQRKLNKLPESVEFSSNQMYQQIIQEIRIEIKQIYHTISKEEPSSLLKEIIVLDYLITLSQLLEIMRNFSLEEFHNRSKIQSIVDGESILEVSTEHVRLIANKLKVLKIL